MAALTMPEIDDGPLRDLLLELHRLHARAGRPGTRKIAGAVGMSHTTVHGVFVSGQLPGLPGLLKIADYLAGRDIRGPGSEDALDRVRSPVDGRRPPERYGDRAAAERIQERAVHSRPQ